MRKQALEASALGYHYLTEKSMRRVSYSSTLKESGRQDNNYKIQFQRGIR